ncbi:hypothetical protein [Cupriavidus sp. UME77]|uniref:hypothetical protein n=1 Tax=Cupriavidus sp. UME77 TaxID=1862321 RepID=UPI0016026CDD|nr:hypothetical protein [Cupriavidus sp. UME77]MBB1632268.1 hypothetical protein [Cupriavidus sp. UME77]
MAVFVMLTVDLNRGVTEEARDKFNEALKQEQWTKLTLTTTWYAKFKEGVTEAGALDTTKVDVTNAASHAGITNYEVAAIPSTSMPTIWNHLR